MTTCTTVDEYIAAQKPDARARLRELRSTIRAAVPQAAEVISYGMPTYRLGARPVYFAAAKQQLHLTSPSSHPQPMSRRPHLGQRCGGTTTC
jgi:uncharacterized protein YdhG (YjbR/CyaY superfamily)